jgi:signal transduction histidine kinase
MIGERITSSNELLRILVIDDDEGDRAALRRGFGQVKANVSLIEHGDPEAALADLPIVGCVILDHQLPGATALEILPALRQRAPLLPIIVLTQHSDEQLAGELLKAGASDYFAKDKLDPRALWRSIRQAVALKNARGRVERAEQARLITIAKMREFVDVLPRLYGGPSTQARAEQAAVTARALFEADEALVAVFADGQEQICVAGPDGVAAPEPGSPWLAFVHTPPPTLPMILGADAVHARRVTSHSGNWHGVVAVRDSALSHELAEALIGNLAENLAMALENVRLVEIANRAVEAREAVMAVVSHDLRSPLNSLGLGLELLSDLNPPASLMQRMSRSMSHMKRLIADLIDVVAIENQELSLRLAHESVPAIVDDLQTLIGPLAAASSIALHIGPAPEVSVVVDRQRVAQVLFNLCNNAFRFTPDGGRVTLTTEVEAGVVRFSVHDEGPGIEATVMPVVFERFARKDGGGLGLGLYIARALVQAMGGSIWAENTSPGARFHFTLPRV